MVELKQKGSAYAKLEANMHELLLGDSLHAKSKLRRFTPPIPRRGGARPEHMMKGGRASSVYPVDSESGSLAADAGAASWSMCLCLGGILLSLRRR